MRYYETRINWDMVPHDTTIEVRDLDTEEWSQYPFEFYDGRMKLPFFVQVDKETSLVPPYKQTKLVLPFGQARIENPLPEWVL